MKTSLWVHCCLVFGVLALAGSGCRNGVGSSSTQNQIGSVTPPSDVSPAVVKRSVNLALKLSKSLANDSQLKGAEISVAVSNLDGTVTLSGTVRRSAQESRAVKLAQKLAGKAKVVSTLKVLKLPDGKCAGLVKSGKLAPNRQD